MKKTYQALLALALTAIASLSSCSDDPINLPEVAVAEIWTSGFSLEWQIGGGEMLIQVSESELFDALLLDSVTANRKGIEFSGFESGSSYFLRYRFIDGGSPSDFSASIPIQTTDLVAPGNVVVDRLIGDEIGLIWNEVRGAKIEVQVSTASSFEDLVEGFENLGTEESSIIIDPLQPLTSYYVRLRSTNNDAVSDWSVLDVITTTDQIFFTLRSRDFGHEGKIPSKFSCNNVSPELHWKNVPEGVGSFAIVMRDLDFQSGFNHLILFNIPSGTLQIPGQTSPTGSVFGTNDLGGALYFGPCPPAGETHRYLFTLYALDATVALSSAVRNDEFLAAIEDNTIDKAILIGLFR